MAVSEDPTTGTDQKAAAFWTRVHVQYNKNIAKANNNRESDPDWRDLPDDRPKGSLKSQWYTRLQPSIQKFAGIVSANPPTSGQIKDDSDMDLYWKSMRLLYSSQAKENLPKKFEPYMKAYFFLSNHPKFGSVLEANEKSGVKRKGCQSKKVSDVTYLGNMDSSRKFPSAAIAARERPGGRDSAKKAKATDFVVEKVTEAVTKSIIQPMDPGPSLKTIQEGMSQANEIMQSMANHQVMAMAPPEIREQYFSEVFDLMNAQARNKRLRLQMENEELAWRMAKLRHEKEYIQQSDHSGDADYNADDGELKIPALPPIDDSTAAFSNESNNAAVGEWNGEEERKEGNADEIGCEKCNYPVCVFEGGGPPLDTCQGSCGRLNKFHHACNVNWLESNGKDSELRKLCYICVQKL